MVGDHYTSTGITLRWLPTTLGNGQWAAKASFRDAGFCDDPSTEGEIHTRYFQRIETAIDTLKADIERFGIQWSNWNGKPWLCMDGDGESTEWPAPDGWRETLQEQAQRIGWQTYQYYDTDTEVASQAEPTGSAAAPTDACTQLRADLRAAEAEVTRLRQELAEINNWQPIETAPEDKLILVYGDHVGWALAHKLLGVDKSLTMYIAGQPMLLQPLLKWHPTHWMPLSNPPGNND